MIAHISAASDATVIAAATTSRNSSALAFPAKSRIADLSSHFVRAAERFASLDLFRCGALHTACAPAHSAGRPEGPRRRMARQIRCPCEGDGERGRVIRFAFSSKGAGRSRALPRACARAKHTMNLTATRPGPLPSRPQSITLVGLALALNSSRSFVASFYNSRQQPVCHRTFRNPGNYQAARLCHASAPRIILQAHLHWLHLKECWRSEERDGALGGLQPA